MYATNSTTFHALAYTGAATLGYQLFGGVVLIFAGIALVTIAACLRHRATRHN